MDMVAILVKLLMQILFIQPMFICSISYKLYNILTETCHFAKWIFNIIFCWVFQIDLHLPFQFRLEFLNFWIKSWYKLLFRWECPSNGVHIAQLKDEAWNTVVISHGLKWDNLMLMKYVGEICWWKRLHVGEKIWMLAKTQVQYIDFTLWASPISLLANQSYNFSHQQHRGHL